MLFLGFVFHPFPFVYSFLDFVRAAGGYVREVLLHECLFVRINRYFVWTLLYFYYFTVAWYRFMCYGSGDYDDNDDCWVKTNDCNGVRNFHYANDNNSNDAHYRRLRLVSVGNAASRGYYAYGGELDDENRFDCGFGLPGIRACAGCEVYRCGVVRSFDYSVRCEGELF